MALGAHSAVGMFLHGNGSAALVVACALRTLAGQGEIELPSRLVAQDPSRAAWAADELAKRNLRETAFDMPRALAILARAPAPHDASWRWVVQVLLDRWIHLGGAGDDASLLPWVEFGAFDAALTMLALRRPQACTRTLLALAARTDRSDVYRVATTLLCKHAPREAVAELLAGCELWVDVVVRDAGPHARGVG